MNVGSINSHSSFDLHRRQFAAVTKQLVSAESVNPEDEVSLRSNRPDLREPVQSIDEALLLASSLRAGILAAQGSALNAQANQDSDGLAELLGQ